jgi:uncharacterized protein YidB (DUF937 family)
MKLGSSTYGSSGSQLWQDAIDQRLVLGTVRNLLSTRRLVSGLLDNAAEPQLAEKFSTWMSSKFEKQELTPEEIVTLVGEPLIQELAIDVKAPEREVCDRLAWLVPRIANQVLPAGKVPSQVERIGLEAIQASILSQMK